MKIVSLIEKLRSLDASALRILLCLDEPKTLHELHVLLVRQGENITESQLRYKLNALERQGLIERRVESTKGAVLFVRFERSAEGERVVELLHELEARLTENE